VKPDLREESAAAECQIGSVIQVFAKAGREGETILQIV